MALTERELEVQNFFPRDESEARDTARDVRMDRLARCCRRSRNLEKANITCILTRDRSSLNGKFMVRFVREELSFGECVLL